MKTNDIIMPKIPTPAAVLAFESLELFAGVAFVFAGVDEAAVEDIFSK
jgi:hypothetical protein